MQSSITSWVNHVTSARKVGTVLGEKMASARKIGTGGGGEGEWQASGRGLKANMAVAIGKGLVCS